MAQHLEFGNPNGTREHLYRAHKLPPICSRCQNEFNTQVELNNHYRAGGCDVIEAQEDGSRGFTNAQEEQLRSRIGIRQLPEEDKWRKIYEILFPRSPVLWPCRFVTVAPLPSDSHRCSRRRNRFHRGLHSLSRSPASRAGRARNFSPNRPDDTITH
jgi:hypothetical protein